MNCLTPQNVRIAFFSGLREYVFICYLEISLPCLFYLQCILLCFTLYLSHMFLVFQIAVICSFNLPVDVNCQPQLSFLTFPVTLCRYAYIWIKTDGRPIGLGNFDESTCMISLFTYGWSTGTKSYLLLKVCCSTCKKPVKASQYAIHTGAVNSFSITLFRCKYFCSICSVLSVKTQV